MYVIKEQVLAKLRRCSYILFRHYGNEKLSKESNVTMPSRIMPPILETSDIDWDAELKQYKTPSVFDSCNEDISDVKPFIPATFNFAAYINKSETLQQFLKLGVNLYEIEQNVRAFKAMVKLDFETDCKKHLMFLNDYVFPENLGNFITKNPYIFQQDLDDLHVRINYLESKKFETDMIQSVVNGNPYWLNFSTHRIDRRLGHFQNNFNLIGNEVRYLATKQPQLITFNLDHVNILTFVIKEELGFEESTLRKMLLDKPRIWMQNQHRILSAFTYLHKVMHISHELISDAPGILLCRESRLRQRHEFLLLLGRAQYDCKKENYVPLYKLMEGDDGEFCEQIAKCSVQDYNLYLKTI